MTNHFFFPHPLCESSLAKKRAMESETPCSCHHAHHHWKQSTSVQRRTPTSRKELLGESELEKEIVLGPSPPPQ